ncbi:MAG: hypothetical protein SFW36_03040, partial [Leptolyngbyaceae cyanobacterium bins.59]|nr:hypothetical protein [Leptolyngbyaceae cyanobacterium bins.59]
PLLRLKLFLASWPVVWATIVLAMGVVTVTLLSRTLPYLRPENQLAPVPSSTQRIDRSDLSTLSTDRLTTLAIESFQQQNPNLGYQAIQHLLDRNDREPAQQVLKSLTGPEANQPPVYFLKGRLAWQAVEAGDRRHSIKEARTYWDMAIQRQPNVPLYQIALGFAYYAEGKLDQADRTWFQALYLLEEKRVAARQQQTHNQPIAEAQPQTNPAFDQEILTTYAGLALVLLQSAEGRPTAKRNALLSRSRELYLKVKAESPKQFHPKVLDQNWLWSKRAIQDWEMLTRTMEGRG